MSHFLPCVTALIRAEGGTKEDQHEPGGISIFGVSLVTYRIFRDDPLISIERFKEEMKVPEDALPIYRWLYWDKFSGDEIESEMIAHLFLDQAANRGVEGFRSLLLACLRKWYGGVFPDEVTFAEMLPLVNSIPERKLFRRLVADAQHSYRIIAFNKFRLGVYKSLEETEEALRVWMVRTHNLLKLME